MKTYIDIGASFFRHPIEYINNTNWEVHLIEPVEKYHLSNLDKYKHIPTVYCHNIAIDSNPGIRDFKIIDEEFCKNNNIIVTDSMRGTIGFDPVSEKDTKRNQFMLNNKDKIYKNIKVKCETFEQFTSNNNIKNIDILKTDTEGFDIQILSEIDLDKYNITELKFEYIWSQQRDPIQYNNFIKKITTLGFKLINKGAFDEIYRR